MIARTEEEIEEAKKWNEICEKAKVALRGVNQNDFLSKLFDYDPIESYDLKDLKRMIKDDGLSAYIEFRCNDYKKGLIKNVFEKIVILSKK